MTERPISDINAEPPPQTTVAPPQTTERKAMVPMQDGKFEFTNEHELASSARLAMTLNLVPNHLKTAGLEACMAALVTCKQYSLPMRAMNEMGFVKGKLTIYGSLYWALAERHSEYGEHELFFVDKDFNKICVDNKNLNADVWAAVIRCRKKNQTVWNEYYFSVDNAKDAGMELENRSSVWFKYRRDMLMHKVKKRMIDSCYSSAVNGLIYHEDAYEHLERNVNSDTESVKELKEAFKSEQQSAS